MSLIYKVILSSEAEKALKKLDKPMTRRIFNALDQLSNDPWNHANTKKMKGTEKDVYRLRVGSYRLIYEIINEELIILVVRIGPRGDIYK
ncbi:type II toxin-antitoxin system RelE family toxin [Paenibacillus azoreducens]|uniref:Plasmid stabilization protein n=1 Tax=Paenibacillus azoreducens TaxID=116718 RepID=A0A919YE82_9BACL|nr:type II toxin-antitoxin system RelE/ParE family toxin [Paenibacillus azoreducens]GIO46837.1 plasmid stabilization protein [Paenibacillus azoreducens]